MHETTLAYGDDLAYIHDVGYDFHARGLAPAVLTMLKQAGLVGSVVVDLGCGSGIWAAELKKGGYRPIGVDISPGMIALAKSRVPDGEFHVASLLDFAFPPCGAITSFGEVVCYQFDRRNNRQALSRLFRKAFAALVRGGLLIFDIIEVGVDRDRPPTWRAGDGWACLVAFEHDNRRQQLIRQITTFRQVGELYRRAHESHRVQLYDGRQITPMLRDAGFSVRTFRRLGTHQLLPERLGFVARKPKRAQQH
jgi:SAM-dependent methyltransferase